MNWYRLSHKTKIIMLGLFEWHNGEGEMEGRFLKKNFKWHCLAFRCSLVVKLGVSGFNLLRDD